MIPGNDSISNRGGEVYNLIFRLQINKPVGVEVGVFKGEMSRYVLNSHPDLILHMVDMWAPHVGGSPYYASGDPHSTTTVDEHETCYQAALENVKEFGERAVIVRKPSVKAAADFADASLDFVFLDADHSFEGVTADLKAWVPKVKPGGFIGGHDYGNHNYTKTKVKEAVLEFFGKEPECRTDMTWFVTL